MSRLKFKTAVVKLLFFMLVCLWGLTSCHQQVTCPELKEEILSWIPYQENDAIELYSQMKDSTIIFSIKSVIVTHTTDYTTGYKCGGCDDEIQINSYDDSNFHVDIYLNNGIITSQTYRIFDSYFPTYTETKNYLFENKEYDIVRIFDNADYSNGRLKKLIIAKDFGVIGLIDVDGNTWTLKTNAKLRSLNGERKNIVINNVSGC